MTGGFMGRLLWVDLSQGTIQEEPLEEETCRSFIGGYGLGARIIYSRQKPGVDPLGPENVLGVLTGPCTGTAAISGSRFMLVGKSPLTGTWGDSDCGGFFGPELKFAGYDGVFFTGAADRPVYLLITNDIVALKDAGHLWGKDTAETEDILRAENARKVRIACIGPAGEECSLISCVIHDKGRAAGRSGLGALMGSKRLKAVVAAGDMRVPINDEPRLKDLRKKYLAQLKDSPGAQARREYGTCASLASLVRLNDTPIKNWSGVGSVDFPNAERISDENTIAYEVKKYACYRCPIACGGYVKVPSGPFEVEGHKPEYETLASFGAMTLNDNVESIIMLNDLCNRMGLDTISAGSALAFATECYEGGLISSSETDGIELGWGDAEAMVLMLEKMAKREGFGQVLADGVKAAAERIGAGAQEYAVHCSGQEPGMHDPKYWPGIVLAYHLDATPGRHGQGGHWMEGFPDWWKESLGVQELPAGPAKYDYAGKGEVFKRAACMLHFIHSSGLCRFPWYHMDPASMWEFVSAVTGWRIGREDAYRTGERIANIRHAFNIREGINPLARRPHRRLVGQPPLEEGPTKGVVLHTGVLFEDFLGAMEWNPENARPNERRLTELGLQDVAEDVC